MMQWIKCSDIPAPKDCEFLAFCLVGFDYRKFNISNDDIRKRSISTCVWNRDKFTENCYCSGYEHDREDIEITHWSPLPEPPKDE